MSGKNLFIQEHAENKLLTTKKKKTKKTKKAKTKQNKGKPNGHLSIVINY